MRTPIGNCFELDLFKKFKATKKANVQLLQDASNHGCNGAYLFATDETADWNAPDCWEFEHQLNQLQKLYFTAWTLSRAA